MSLLKKAKTAINQRFEPTDEQIELAVAWAFDEIKLTQVANAIEKQTTGTYIFLARTLKHYLKTLPRK